MNSAATDLHPILSSSNTNGLRSRRYPSNRAYSGRSSVYRISRWSTDSRFSAMGTLACCSMVSARSSSRSCASVRKVESSGRLHQPVGIRAEGEERLLVCAVVGAVAAPDPLAELALLALPGMVRLVVRRLALFLFFLFLSLLPRRRRHALQEGLVARAERRPVRCSDELVAQREQVPLRKRAPPPCQLVVDRVGRGDDRGGRHGGLGVLL